MARHRRPPTRLAVYRHRAWLVGWAALILAGLFALTGSATAQVATEPVETTKSCIIRFYSTGPQVYENSAHECSADVTSVTKSNGNLRVERPTQPGERVTYFAATADIDIAKQTLICGGSGGLGLTIFACYRARDGAHMLPKPGSTVNLNLTWHVIIPAVQP